MLLTIQFFRYCFDLNIYLLHSLLSAKSLNSCTKKCWIYSYYCWKISFVWFESKHYSRPVLQCDEISGMHQKARFMQTKMCHEYHCWLKIRSKTCSFWSNMILKKKIGRIWGREKSLEESLIDIWNTGWVIWKLISIFFYCF